MAENTIPTTRSEFLEKYSSNFRKQYIPPKHEDWRKETWCPDAMEMRPATPVGIAEEALETAARNCRVEELLDPIRALVDAKVMEALARSVPVSVARPRILSPSSRKDGKGSR
jgi:hypothetical protein